MKSPYVPVPVAVYSALIQAGIRQVFDNVPRSEVPKIIKAYRLAIDKVEEAEAQEQKAAMAVALNAADRADRRAASAFEKLQKAVSKASEDNYEERYKHYPRLKMPAGWKMTISKDCPHGHSEWWSHKSGAKAKMIYRKLYKQHLLQVVEVKKENAR